jgi:hypothetical protein
MFDIDSLGLIPLPQSITVSEQHGDGDMVDINLNRAVVIPIGDDAQVLSDCNLLVHYLELFGLPIVPIVLTTTDSNTPTQPHSITVAVDDSIANNTYRLSITKHERSGSISLVAQAPSVLTQAIQTLAQLLSSNLPQINTNGNGNGNGNEDGIEVIIDDDDQPPQVPVICSLPASLQISDRARYQWRGLHLDCCRHFMPLPFIARFLDLMALHKFNVFHCM